MINPRHGPWGAAKARSVRESHKKRFQEPRNGNTTNYFLPRLRAENVGENGRTDLAQSYSPKKVQGREAQEGFPISTKLLANGTWTEGRDGLTLRVRGNEGG